MKTINFKTVVLSFASLALLFSTACSDLLDRPPLTSEDDATYWDSEAKVKNYAYAFYPRFFVGYNSGFDHTAVPYLGFNLDDNTVHSGNQPGLELVVPTSRGSVVTSITADYMPWLSSYSGPSWHFSWIRRANIMIDRVENRMAGILNEEQKSHWSAVGRFFRALNYAELVQVFGDVPYYDHEVASDNKDDMYKPRTPRNEVMDAVYDDFVTALGNVRPNDGALTLDRYTVAGFVARHALIEGTWQKYHLNDTERARKFLDLAVRAADVVMSSGNYDITMEFRDQFTQTSLSGKRDVIFWRSYGTGAKHSVSSYMNLSEGRSFTPNLALLKSFICNDGSDWQTSDNAENKKFDMETLVKTRDPRFEGTFLHKPSYRATPSFLYMAKFIPRSVLDLNGMNIPSEYTSQLNVNAYPVMRYAEVLLSWIEAKAELATMGGAAVTQSDINASINKLRSRPIAAAAVALGVKKSADMDIEALPDSPDRGNVSRLIWEIRRERRMELAMEYSRLVDLRRWKKLEYMDTAEDPDLLLGAWVDGSVAEIGDHFVNGESTVTDMNGTVTQYNGTNKAQMRGFYSRTTVRGRQPFLNVPNVNPYLAPVGITQQRDYLDKGYELKQTEGWPTGL